MSRSAIRSAALLGALTALGGSASAQTCQGEPGGPRLDIVVDGVRSDQGLITTTLYPADAARFLKANGELAVWRTPAAAPATQTCVYVPAPGPYAVAVYDDLNRNLKFDHTTFGPLEPYGFSNNPRLFLGPPGVRAASVEVPAGGATIHIQLRYPR